MRVLILATDIYTHGGIARYTSTLASALGHFLGPQNVHVFALLNWGSRDDAPDGFRVVGLVSNRAGLTSKLQFAWRAMRLGRQRYDLVIANHVGLAPVAAMIRYRYGTPFWVACHGTEVWRRLSPLKRAALKRAALVLSVSRYTAGMLSRVNSISRSRTRILFNAIPPEFANLLLSPEGLSGSSPVRNDKEPLLLSVGGVSKAHEYKGVDMVIRAMPKILAAVPAAHYVVVGHGDNRRELEQLAAEGGVAHRVTFVGEIRDVELAALYRACDLFVMPSRASKAAGLWTGEGFGRVYVEAALAGKPVVGSRAGGAAEAVLDGKTGLLVNPFSVDEIVGAVVSLLTKPNLAQTMGVEARKWAAANFCLKTVERGLQEMVRPYQSAC